MSASCIFCKIIKGEIPSFKLLETAKSYAFLDIGPLSKGHALVIPKVPNNPRCLAMCGAQTDVNEGACHEIARVVRRVSG